MKLTQVKKVYETGTHAYDGSQRETAIRVLLATGRRCWLVGYGGDYVPAAKHDINNIYDMRPVDDDTLAQRVGQVVHAHRI